MSNHKLNQAHKEIDFSPEIVDKIVDLTKKYKLGPVDLFDNPEMERKLAKAKTQKEALEIIENRPFKKIVRIVQEVAQEEISEENLSLTLKEKLEISISKAGELAEYIKQKILPLIKNSQLKKPTILESPPRSSKDIYREPIK